MNKYIKSLIVLFCATALLSSCTEDEGTTPGGDGSPVATLYVYEPGDGYNADNDCRVRVATNAAASEVYYLAELKSDKEARNMTPEQYADYVVANGTKVDVAPSNTKDFYLTNLHGEYEITAVAVNGSTKNVRTASFAGLDYQPYGNATLTSEMFGNTQTVQIEHSVPGDRYRVVGPYANGYDFSFSIKGATVTVYPTTFETGYTHPSYGMVSATDKGSSFDEATKLVTFKFDFTVSAGSFGTKTEQLQFLN